MTGQKLDMQGRCAPAAISEPPEGHAAMDFLFFLAFVLFLALASFLGLTVETRDSADWKPTTDGFRWRSRTS
ncbi:MAG TPA: hypothetical protein VF462_10845 [Micromonosporaceae bacterium]